MRALQIAVLVVALSGCYTYGAIDSRAPAPGMQLRVTLTIVGSDSLARWLGPNVGSVDGRLIQDTQTAYELGVSNVVMHSGMEQYWKGETVTLPKPYISSVQERKFSWEKTGILAGILVVTFVALQQSGAIGGNSSSNGDGGPPK